MKPHQTQHEACQQSHRPEMSRCNGVMHGLAMGAKEAEVGTELEDEERLVLAPDNTTETNKGGHREAVVN